MKKVLITGGTGLVGRHLVKKLQAQGMEVAVLSRNPTEAYEYQWDITKEYIDEKALENVTSIVHLAGAGIADKRWSTQRKQEIITSRVASIQLLFKKVNEYHTSLESFISASGIGFYGAITSSKIFTEVDSSANDFLGTVCRLWEQAVTKFQSQHCRTVILRTGIVLAKGGGALAKMKTPVISPIGSGKQYMPWIHIDDLCEMYLKAIVDEKVKGVYNAVAPEHQTNTAFSKAFAKSIQRTFLPLGVPAFLLRLIFGEMAIILLKGSRVSSEKLKKTGFQFRFNTLKSALDDLHS